MGRCPDPSVSALVVPACPAILKGWIDRVYSYGVRLLVSASTATSVGGDRYGEGTLVGKRAMLLVTTGGWEDHYSARGIKTADRRPAVPDQSRHSLLSWLRRAAAFRRLRRPIVSMRPDSHPSQSASATECESSRPPRPSPIGRQNGGDYLIPSMQLRQELGNPDATGFALHLNGADAAG